MSPRYLAVLGALAACRPTPPAAPVPVTTSEPVAREPAAAEADSDPDDADEDDHCETTASHVGAFLRPGEPVQLELRICTGEDTAPHGDEAAEQGFVETPKAAAIVITAGGHRLMHDELASWTNGWEWGEAWTLPGMLRGDGHVDAVVLAARSWGEGSAASQVMVVSFADGTASTLWSVDGVHTAITFAKDQTALEVDIVDDPDGTPYSPPDRTMRAAYSGGVIAVTPIR